MLPLGLGPLACQEIKLSQPPGCCPSTPDSKSSEKITPPPLLEELELDELEELLEEEEEEVLELDELEDVELDEEELDELLLELLELLELDELEDEPLPITP